MITAKQKPPGGPRPTPATRTWNSGYRFSFLDKLLQNAFKFTEHGTRVLLSVHVVGERIRLDVLDHCGGLPPGNPEDLLLPFKQYSAEKSGVGLGLSIRRRSVEANKGVLTVRDLPGSGCVFSIDLPKR